MTIKTFLITGVSQGLGRAFAEAALVAGHRVVGTVRQEAARAEFERLDPQRAKAVVLDVTDFAAIGPVVAEVERELGAIDVLVNNAGYLSATTSKLASRCSFRTHVSVTTRQITLILGRPSLSAAQLLASQGR
jgi:NAD(P)-dependent dehydrogenase (short-subunit alcohol dehydrogenase family)